MEIPHFHSVSFRMTGVSKYNVEGYSQSGVCVLINDNQAEQLNVSGLADGFYLVRIYVGGIPVTKKIIIKR